MPGDPLRAKYVAEHYLETPSASTPSGTCWATPAPTRAGSSPSWATCMGVPSIASTAMSSSVLRRGHHHPHRLRRRHRRRRPRPGRADRHGRVHQLPLCRPVPLPRQLCATADFGLLRTAVETAEKMGVRADVGQVFTSDQFYNDNPDAGETYRKFGILGVRWRPPASTGRPSGSASGPEPSDRVRPSVHRGVPPRPGAAGLLHEMMEIALETAWKTLED